MKQQNLMVINGRTYDARSGLPLDSVAPHPQGQQQAVPPKRPQTQGRTMDIAVAKVPATARKKVAAKQIHHTPQRGKTLVRHAVAPRQATPAQAATQPRPTPTVQTIVPEAPRAASAHISRFAGDVAPRQKRAEIQPRAQQVQRFAPQAPVAVHAPAPAQVQPQPAAPQHFQLPSKLHQDAAATRHAVHTAHHGQSLQQRKEALIAKQLAAAPAAPLTDEKQPGLSQQQRKVRHFFAKQPRLLNAVAGMAVVLILVGYVTFLNMPAISMRVAISRAGFDATMPGYKPSGYSMQGPVAYSPGEVSLTFDNNTNEDDFKLTQKESSWDSKALLDNFVSKETKNYLTYQEKGLTVYMFDGKAAWVNGGIWYSIDGSSKLSSDQILKLATSM